MAGWIVADGAGQIIAHARGRIVQEDRADPDALIRHQSAVAADESVQVEGTTNGPLDDVR